MRGHRIMAITSAFQADDAGSIPAARSNLFIQFTHKNPMAERTNGGSVVSMISLVELRHKTCLSILQTSRGWD